MGLPYFFSMDGKYEAGPVTFSSAIPPPYLLRCRGPSEGFLVRYLFAVIDSQSNSGTMDEMVAINAFNNKIEAAGQRIMAAGVSTPSSAFLVDNRDGSESIVHGPAVDSDEYMAGFWVIEAANDDVAQALALEASFACKRRIEVRAFL